MKEETPDRAPGPLARQEAILIIDDQPTSIFVLGQMLRENYRVYVATGGRQGLEMARQYHPDLILLDISMPDVDGYMVCRQLKGNPGTQDIPVIFITSMQDSDNESLGLELGALDYIVKPFRPAIVLARIKNHLRLQQTLRELAWKNRELERLSELRDSMEQISRHDLKNSLGLILNLPMFMQDIVGTTREHMEVAALVEKNGYRMLDMINNTLALHKMESGAYEFMRAAIDLHALLSDVVQEMQPLAISKRLALRLMVEDEGSYCCLGEERLLYSMVANLIKNAIEASPEGRPVTIRLEQGITLRIHNHGSIPEEMRPRLFEKFASHGKPHGTGLGSYSAKLVAKLHGGQIVPCMGEDDTEIVVMLPPSCTGPTHAFHEGPSFSRDLSPASVAATVSA